MPIHFQFRDDPRFQAWQHRVGGRPGWVWKSAALAAVLVVVVPLVLLTLAAAVVGLAVFAVMSLVAAIVGGLSNVLGGPRGKQSDAGSYRHNVRVIERP